MTKVLATTGPPRTTRKGLRWSVSLERKIEDLWIGAFWSTTKGPTGRWAVLDVWVTLVPCHPVHLFLNRPRVGP